MNYFAFPANLGFNLICKQRHWHTFLLSCCILTTTHHAAAQESDYTHPFEAYEVPIAIHAGAVYTTLKGYDFKNTQYVWGNQVGLNMVFNVDDFSKIETGSIFSLRGFGFRNKDTLAMPGAIQVPDIRGSCRLFMLDFPFLFYKRLNRNIKIVAGGYGSLKFLSQQIIRGNVQIIRPDTSFSIPFENKSRNNAIDLIDLSATVGLGYHFSDRVEGRVQAHFDLFGLSIGEKNAFTRSNNQQWMSLSLVYWLGDAMSIF